MNHILKLAVNSTAESAVEFVKINRPDISVIVLENTQAVTAYSLKKVSSEFYSAGADYILCGEGDYRAVLLTQLILDAVNIDRQSGIDGLGSPAFFKPPKGFIENQLVQKLVYGSPMTFLHLFRSSNLCPLIK